MEQRNAQEIQPSRSVKFGLHIVTGETSIETWIYVPESKQQFTIGYFKMKPTKVIRSRSAKQIACSFGYIGHVTTVVLEEGL